MPAVAAGQLLVEIHAPWSVCSRYTNLETNGMASMLAVARLRDDRHELKTAATAIRRSCRFWTQLFDRLRKTST